MATSARLWPTFARVIRRHPPMDEMMEACGVDLLTAVGARDGFVQARANCRECAHESACRDWYLEATGTPADFCPNVDFFRALQTRGPLSLTFPLQGEGDVIPAAQWFTPPPLKGEGFDAST
jgi:hypothetical protein